MPSSNDYFAPALWDRFVKPGDKSKPADIKSYTDNILRDLRWLLESRTTLDPGVSQNFPDIATSVLNYGIGDQAGANLLRDSIATLELQIREAIKSFEPRINGKTLTVRHLSEEEMSRNKNRRVSPNCIAFEIHAEIWAAPSPIKIWTELNIATGHHRLVEESGDALSTKPAH